MSTRFTVGQVDYIFQLNLMDDQLQTGVVNAASNVAVSNDSATNTTVYLCWTNNSGTANAPIKTSSSKLTYNPASGQITTTAVVVGSLRCNGTSAIGYATGAGGTIAQATSKVTGVTLNKAFGDITLTADSIAAGAVSTFTLTSTSITATDTLVLNHQSGGTAGAYTLNAQCAAGSATINVRNATAGALAEAIVIRFAVLKGALA